ncbi:ABC-2 transporter permease (plasmid) [Bacillus thuringiensis]|nr:ABC-2 transporter permease [Bacillus thuringiensis]
MTSKFLSSFVIFLKLNLRSAFFLTSIMLGIFYISVLIYYYTSSVISNPGNILQLSSFLIQGSMFIFMMLGYQAVKIEEEYTSKEIILTIPHTYSIKVFSNFFFVILINLLFCILSLIVFFISYRFIGIQFSIFYKNAFLFITLYWFLPFLISSIIGLVVGIWFRNNKISFSIIFFCWFIISPMNVHFLKSFFEMLNILSFPNFIQLGLEDPNMLYNTFKGYQITLNHFIKAFFWIGFVLFILSLTILIKNKQMRTKIIFLCISISLLLSISWLFPYTTTSQWDTERLKSFDTEAKFYNKKENSIKNPSIGFNYIISKYDIKLEVTNNAAVTATLFFAENYKDETVKFILHHNFIIKKVVNDKKENLSFQQKGDIITINTSGKNALENLTIQYEGKGSLFTPTDQEGLYLPFYSSWLPVNKQYLPLKLESNQLYRLPMQNLNEVQYNLNYIGPKPLYTNLKQVGENLYNGKLKESFSLISGELTDKTFNDYKIVYPLTWERTMKNVPEYLEQLEKVFRETKRILDLKITLPKTIVVAPVLEINDMTFSSYMWLHDDHLIFKISPYEDHDETKMITYKKMIPYHLISAMTWKKEAVTFEQDDLSLLFSCLYGDYLNKKFDIEYQYESDFWISEIKDRLKKESSKNTLAQASTIVNSKNPIMTERFFKEWYEEMMKGNFNWENLKVISDKYIGGK